MGRYYKSGISRGIGTSPQTTLENLEYENKVNEIEENSKKMNEQDNKQKADILHNEIDIKKLEEAGVKFNKEDVIFVANDSSGQLIWLEKGNDKSGLSHIKNRHATDFCEKHRVSIDNIPQHIRTIIEKGKLEYSKVTQRNGRECYERLYSKSDKYFLQTGVGSNGYLVSAYPISEKEALALIRRNKKMKEKVVLDLDFNQGAIWISDQETGEPITGIEIIDNNKDIAVLNKKISDLYSSYYYFETSDSNCYFDKEKFMKEKNILLNMVDELKKLLEKINDGSFEVEDRITSLYD